MFYLAARQWGIQPSEFWAMTMHEWFTEYRFNVGEAKVGGTSMTEDRVDEIKAWAEEIKAKRNGAAKN